jgi:hypothetical protein
MAVCFFTHRENAVPSTFFHGPEANFFMTALPSCPEAPVMTMLALSMFFFFSNTVQLLYQVTKNLIVYQNFTSS